MDLDRNQARQRDVHQHRRERLADRRLWRRRSSITANTTYVASYHTTGAYVATNNFFTTAVTSGVLTAPSTTTRRRQRCLCLWRHQHRRHLPDQHLRCRQLLGRCGVHRVSTAPNTPPTAVADTADATEKGGVANGSGGSPATGNVLTNDTDPDAGDTKTVTAVSFGATAGTLGTALAGAHGSLVLNAAGRLHLHRQRDRCRGAGACGNRPIR